MRDRKRENRKKKANINLSTLALLTVIQLGVLIVNTKFEYFSGIRYRAVMMQNFIGMIEKWTNKGTDKPYAVADSFMHSKTFHT